MIKGPKYLDMKGVKADIQAILDKPPYNNADPSVNKIMLYLESITNTDSPGKLTRYVGEAIKHIEKNKQEAVPANLKEKLMDIKEYCAVREKYTTIFAAISGLKNVLLAKLKTDNQALLEDISTLNKLLIDIEAEIETPNSKSNTEFTAKFQAVDEMIAKLKKHNELQKGTTWFHAAEMLAIIDELQLISFKFKRQKALQKDQDKALDSLSDKIKDINDYVFLRNNDLVKLTALRDKEYSYIANKEKELKELSSNIAEGKLALIARIKEEIKPLQNDFEKSKNEENLQGVKDKAYQQFFDEINKEIAKLDDTVMSQYLDTLIDMPQKNITFRFLKKYIFDPIREMHKKDTAFEKILLNANNYLYSTDTKPSSVEITKEFTELHKAFKAQMQIKKEIDEFNEYHALRENVYEVLKFLKMDKLTLDAIAMAQYEKHKITEERRKPLPQAVKQYKGLDLNKLEEQLTQFLENKLISKALEVTEETGVSIAHIAIAEKHGATVVATFNQGKDPLIAGDLGHCAGIAIGFAKSILKKPNSTLQDIKANYPKTDSFHIDAIGIVNATHHYQDHVADKKIARSGTKTILHQKEITGKRSKNIVQKIKYNEKEVIWSYAPKDKNATFAQTINHRIDEILAKGNAKGKVIDISIWKENEKSKTHKSKFREIEMDSGHALLLGVIKDGCVFVDANYGIYHFKNDETSTGLDKFKLWFEDFIEISYKNVLTDYFNLTDLSLHPKSIEEHISTVETNQDLVFESKDKVDRPKM